MRTLAEHDLLDEFHVLGPPLLGSEAARRRVRADLPSSRRLGATALHGVVIASVSARTALSANREKRVLGRASRWSPRAATARKTGSGHDRARTTKHRPSGRSTRATRSSSRTRGTPARRACSRRSASRRSPPPAPASRSRSVALDGERDARRGRRARRGVLDGATGLPVSVDLENGYGPDARGRGDGDRARRAGRRGRRLDRGLRPRATGSTSSSTRSSASPRPSRRPRGLDFPFTLTARAENHIRGNPDLDDTIARLQAYERAGADVLYAPGLRNVDEIRAVCDAVSKPVNVLAHPGLTMSEVAEAGAQRVSVGGGLTWVAAAARSPRAEQIRDAGDFSALGARVNLSSCSATDAALRRVPARGQPRRAGAGPAATTCARASRASAWRTSRPSGPAATSSSRRAARRVRKLDRPDRGTPSPRRSATTSTVFLRTAEELEAIAAEQPFPAELVERSKGKLQVALLPSKPSAGARKRVAGDGHRRGSARVRRPRALLAAKRRNARRGPRPGGRGEADRAVDDAHQGHPRSCSIRSTSRSVGDPQTSSDDGATVDCFGQPANHAGTTSSHSRC